MKKRNLAVSLTLAAAMALTTACPAVLRAAALRIPLQHRRKRQAADTSAAEGARVI